MLKKFSTLTNNAGTGDKSPIRALQAWQFLIGKAKNRQIVKYNEIAELMGYTDSRPLTSILACIMWFCDQNKLPPLTVIVVNKSGVPGEGYNATEWDTYHKDRERVFNYDWYNLIPPTIAQFKQAAVNAKT